MARMQAVYYRDANGDQPVDAFIEGLTTRQQVIVDNQIDRLNMVKPDDPPLPFPHSSQVDGQLRELRCHAGRELYRIFYRRSENLFILLHAFRKDTDVIPLAEIATANARWADFKARMDAPRRRRPRAVGRNAP
jgi:phage-related protein